MTAPGEHLPDDTFLYAEPRTADELMHDFDYLQDVREITERMCAAEASIMFPEGTQKWAEAYDRLRAEAFEEVRQSQSPVDLGEMF